MSAPVAAYYIVTLALLTAAAFNLLRGWRRLHASAGRLQADEQSRRVWRWISVNTVVMSSVMWIGLALAWFLLGSHEWDPGTGPVTVFAVLLLPLVICSITIFMIAKSDGLFDPADKGRLW